MQLDMAEFYPTISEEILDNTILPSNKLMLQKKTSLYEKL